MTTCFHELKPEHKAKKAKTIQSLVDGLLVANLSNGVFEREGYSTVVEERSAAREWVGVGMYVWMDI